MKKLSLTYILFFAVILSFMSVSVYAGVNENLLINGNFENGLEGWVDIDCIWDTDNEYKAASGEYFVWPKQGSSGYTSIYQDVSLDGFYVGEKYILTGFLSTWNQEPFDVAELVLQFLDNDGNVIKTQSCACTTPEWTQYTFEGLLPQGAGIARIKLIATRNIGLDNDGYFDDISFVVSENKYMPVSIICESDRGNIGDVLKLRASNGVTSDFSDFDFSVSDAHRGAIYDNGTVKILSDGEFTIKAVDKVTKLVAYYFINSDKENVKCDEFINMSDWASEYFESAKQSGIINEDFFYLNVRAGITRAEFSNLLVNMYEQYTGTEIEITLDNPFIDTTDKGVLKAYELGIINGITEDTFGPFNLINREQAASLLARIYLKIMQLKDPEFSLTYNSDFIFDDDSIISEWAKPSIYFLYENNLITGMGDNLFAPKNTTLEQKTTGFATTTREQAVILSVRMFEFLSKSN